MLCYSMVVLAAVCEARQVSMEWRLYMRIMHFILRIGIVVCMCVMTDVRHLHVYVIIGAIVEIAKS